MQYCVYFNYQKNENIPVRKKGGWFDIPLPYDLYFEVGEVVKIAFDLRVKMPKGFEAIIQPRSSTLEKTGLISSGFGVIEDSYCGENDYIGYRFYATRDGLVSKGSCLVQMRFQEKMKECVPLRANDTVFNGVKNRGGFGSTDKDNQFAGTKEGLANKLLSLTHENKFTRINQLDWEPDDENQTAFSAGYEDGHQDGYEEGFRAGYDKAIEDLALKHDKEKQ